MKKIIVLTLILLVLAIPASAALRMLPESQVQELESIAKEHIAAERNISVDRVIISEAWVRDLWNIEKEIYIIIARIDGQKEHIEVAVDIVEKIVYNREEMEALVAEDLANEPDEPIFRTESIGAPDADDGFADITSGPESDSNKIVYIVGIAMIFGLGAGGFVLKSKLRP
jgi:hypothetical protein